MSKNNIKKPSDYWNRYGIGEVDYVASKPEPEEFDLSESDVEAIEYADNLARSHKKRNDAILFWSILAMFVLFFVYFYWQFDSYGGAQDLLNRIFLIIGAAMIALMAVSYISIAGWLLINGIKKIAGFFGYELTKPGDYAVSNEKRKNYDSFALKTYQYQYWHLIRNPAAWRDEARPHLIIRDILKQIGFDRSRYKVSSDTDSYLFDDGQDKVYVNIKSGNEIITEHYINTIKIEASENECVNVLIYTPYVKIAKGALATVMTMKDDDMNVDIYTPERFTSRLEEFNI